ncbi:MAG: NeuD/PglB/VioB family sugar acetyltransferase [Anaerolineaceae bacterium]|mgnify:CR=1 FL=1
MTDELLSVFVPLVNPNESEALLAEVLVKEGDWVEKGQPLASFETTKSSYELVAEADGYILGLMAHAGDTLRAGDPFCYLAGRVDLEIPLRKSAPMETNRLSEAIPQGLRITQPALALAKSKGVTLEELPKGILVTEKMIADLASVATAAEDARSLIIYGGGGHAKSLIDLIRMEGKYQIAGIVDDRLPAGSLILGVPVLGGAEQLGWLRQKGIFQAVNAVGGIGSIAPRLAVYQRLAEAGFQCVTVIHPRAFIEPNASLSQGCQVFFNGYVGSEVKVGFGAILNTGAILSHECILGDYVNISPGAILAGAVNVGDRVLIGMGATINLGVTIGAGARIGNSAVVKADVPENGIVRAGAIWPPD